MGEKRRDIIIRLAPASVPSFFIVK